MAAASSLNGPNPHNGSFGGMALTPEQARLILIAMPWEATVSYGTGTSRGPQAILDASPKMDFHNELFPDFWKKAGLAFLPPAKEWQAENDRIRPLAARAIAAQEGALQVPPQELAGLLDKVNTSCTAMTAHVEHEAARWLAAGKVVGVVGGDHSCPLGLIRALAKNHTNMGILHIDAHADLREDFEGFPYSHASVMFNALKEPAVTRLIQVGIRDFCEEEVQRATESTGRVRMFTASALHRRAATGKTWQEQVRDIIADLPQVVYISFDIDGLDPLLCPHTGTPVPGGLAFEDAMYLIEQVALSGRTIAGFDVCEVAPGPDGSEWGANVGARVIYRLACATAASQKWLTPAALE
jgi:agmatinase